MEVAASRTEVFRRVDVMNLVTSDGPEKMEMVASLGSCCGPQGWLICRMTGDDGKVRPALFTKVEHISVTERKNSEALQAFRAIGHDAREGYIFEVEGRIAYHVPENPKHDDLNKLYLTDRFKGYYDAKSRKGVLEVTVTIFGSFVAKD